MQPTPTRSPTRWRGDLGPDLGDDADDLVAGDHGEGLRAPVAVDGVDVGVADAGVLDLDEDVVRADGPALDGGGGQGPAGGGGGVGVDAHGSCSSFWGDGVDGRPSGGGVGVGHPRNASSCGRGRSGLWGVEARPP